MIRITQVQPLDGFKVKLSFTDSSEKTVDLDGYLRGPLFQPLRSDPILFRNVYVDHGTIRWPNGADICPDVLYYGRTPAWAESDKAAG